MRRATKVLVQCLATVAISIHALREEGDIPYTTYINYEKGISIHALREEGDWERAKEEISEYLFQSTPSVRRATLHSSFNPRFAPFQSTPSVRRATIRGRAFRVLGAISIHALREEGDKFCLSFSGIKSISIHALREEGDYQPFAQARCAEISIHALREEGDDLTADCRASQAHFNPRPP